jgi:hypothetical protein
MCATLARIRQGSVTTLLTWRREKPLEFSQNRGFSRLKPMARLKLKVFVTS